MSTHRHHLHAASQDPTHTKTVRRIYGQRLRGAFSRINTAIREAITEDDIFNLKDTSLFAVDKPPDFSFDTDDAKIEGFQEWLREAQEGEVLEVIDRNDNRFIRQAYHKGLENATQDLQEAGVEVDTENIDQVFNLGVHQQEVQRLYTRNFTELEGITREVDRQVSRELANGFSEGHNPNKIARNISDRVNKIGKTRATTLARTEVIRSHSVGQLNRYERMGVDEVTVKAELLTAQDARVCEQCAALEGNVYTLEEARGLIPVHPQCRCRHIPLVNN